MRIRNTNTQNKYKPFVNAGYDVTAHKMRETQSKINQKLLLALQKKSPKPSNSKNEYTLNKTLVNNILSNFTRPNFNTNFCATVQLGTPFMSIFSGLGLGLRQFSTSSALFNITSNTANNKTTSSTYVITHTDHTLSTKTNYVELPLNP